MGFFTNLSQHTTPTHQTLQEVVWEFFCGALVTSTLIPTILLRKDETMAQR